MKAITKLQKKYIVLGSIFVIILSAVLPAFLWHDASTQYTGIKKEVATYAVSNAWDSSSGINYTSIFGTIRITAENVTADSAHTGICNGEFISPTEPEAGDDFLATITYRTFFGISLKSDTFHICRDLHPSN